MTSAADRRRAAGDDRATGGAGWATGGTSGGLFGTSGGQRRAFWQAFITLALLTACVDTVNVFTVTQDWARTGHPITVSGAGVWNPRAACRLSCSRS